MRSSELLKVLIKACYPVTYVVSHEEDRVVETLVDIAKQRNEALGQRTPIYSWSVTQSVFSHYDERTVPDLEGPIDVLEYIEGSLSAVFILKDFGHFLSEGPAYMVQRKLKDTINAMNGETNIFIVDSELVVPPRLEKIITVVDFDLPEREEIAEYIRERNLLTGCFATSKLKEDESNELIQVGAEACAGLTLFESLNVFSKSLAMKQTVDTRVVVDEKKQIIRKSGVLEYIDHSLGLDSVGGLANFKTWLNERGKAFSDEARDFGLPNPKGVLLVGVPGAGKSLVAKCAGYTWGIPVLRMDVGALHGQYVGQSEANTRKAFQTAEAIGRCILWIDELEKGFGPSGSTNDGGTSARVFGTFLNWMQENDSQVFVVATANDVSALPPEMLRKGRFDELFFVDLPNDEERVEILKIHLTKRNRNPENYDLNRVSLLCKGFSGAELEQVIVDGLFRAFSRSDDLTEEDLFVVSKRLVPLSRTMKSKIENLRKWSNGRAILASEAKKEPENKKRRRSVH